VGLSRTLGESGDEIVDGDVTAGGERFRIRGSYFESCNCDPVCPCRTVGGRRGGRSTHGVCLGVLSWLIDEGSAGGVDLAGQPVVLAIRYSDDEPGSPWTWIFYLDAQARTDVSPPASRRLRQRLDFEPAS